MSPCTYQLNQQFNLSICTNMAKAAKTAIKTKDQKAAAEAKNWSKVIRTVRSPKTGAYTFKEAIVHKDKIKDFLAGK